jgi:glycosyltransferase involved in cell wall biosynthesis
MKVLIWSPFISSDIGTVGTVLNTAKCINKFSNQKYNLSLINVAGEWQKFNKFLSENEIKSINLNIRLSFKNLPKGSYFKSRLTYILISLFSLFKLHKLLKKEKPEFFFVHLLTFTPLLLMILFKYKTKFILRISGYPKINFLRKFFWKLSNKKINKILCPTYQTKKQLMRENIFDESKLYVVHEPILDLKKIRIYKEIKDHFNYKQYGKYVVSIGRLTKQKNHRFLIKCFNEILRKDPDLKLLICGEGEERNNLKKLIIDIKRENNIYLLGYVENIIPVLKNSLFFILTSEWEDPGFVIIESMFSNTIVYSSDCKNGPIDLIKNYNNGFLYKKNNKIEFIENFFSIHKLILQKDQLIKKIKFNAKYKTRLYTLFNHYKKLKEILK